MAMLEESSASFHARLLAFATHLLDDLAARDAPIFAGIEFPPSILEAGQEDFACVVHRGTERDVAGHAWERIGPVGHDVANLRAVESGGLDRPDEHVHAVIGVRGIGVRLDAVAFLESLSKGIKFRILALGIPRVTADDA